MLIAGTTFLIADESGDVPSGGTTGLFVDDTRHLSSWELLVDGQRLRPLSTHRDAFSADTVLVPAAVRGKPPHCVVFRTQVVDAAGLVERLRVRDLSGAARGIEIRYVADADFADQFELRSDRSHDKPGATRTSDVTTGRLLLRYQREGYVKTTTVLLGDTGQQGLVWHGELGPHAEITLTTRVTVTDSAPVGIEKVIADAREDRDAFIAGFDLPAIDEPRLSQAVHKGLEDLAALRIPASGVPGMRIPGAGAPWFLTLFGRDSLITALAALPYQPGMAATTLRTLAAHQGQEFRPERCEEPGKIVHEIRSGELSRFGQVPYARYYGTVDATPLFLVLLGAHYERTGDASLARELEAAARAAMAWVERGLADGGGYLRYATDTPGLVHQCWKDSADSMVFASGEPAVGPIAAVEVQGYAFDALTRTARLARDVWGDPAYADHLSHLATTLRDRFTADFWLPDADFPAIALDGPGKPVDLLASNAGHLLFSGLPDERQARAIAHRLLAPEFFSGWGLRTVAAGQRPYHPISYHNGGVWPHDTAIAVAGLARYGLADEAARLADGLLDTAARFSFRLPEVLAGFGTDEVAAPVPYPHSCSPQAWAAAAPLLLVSALVR